MPKKKEEKQWTTVDKIMIEIFGDYETWTMTMMKNHLEFKEKVEGYLKTHQIEDGDRMLIGYLLKG